MDAHKTKFTSMFKFMHENNLLLTDVHATAQAIHYGWIVIEVDGAMDTSYHLTSTGQVIVNYADDTDVTPDMHPIEIEYAKVVTELDQMRQAYAKLDDDYLARGKEVKELRQAIKDCQVVLTIGGSEYDHIALLDIETILNKVSGND